MRQHVYESLAFQRLVQRRPIRHVLDSMPLEEFRRVFPETPQQVVQLALGGVVDTQFVDHG